MDDITSKDHNRNIKSSSDAMSEENNEVKCDNSENNCTFQISKDNEEDAVNEKILSNINGYKTEAKSVNNGEIIVTAILDCGEHESLQGVRINLYKINGLSPILIKSKITDEEGKVIFHEIEEGCYRIIEIIDKKYFEKPKYINWNEIIINRENHKQKIVIVNKIKKNVLQKNIVFRNK